MIWAMYLDKPKRGGCLRVVLIALACLLTMWLGFLVGRYTAECPAAQIQVTHER